MGPPEFAHGFGKYLITMSIYLLPSELRTEELQESQNDLLVIGRFRRIRAEPYGLSVLDHQRTCFSSSGMFTVPEFKVVGRNTVAEFLRLRYGVWIAQFCLCGFFSVLSPLCFALRAYRAIWVLRKVC